MPEKRGGSGRSNSVGTPTKTPKADRTRNLRPPWPKGTSGNPAGRPRKPWAEAYLERSLRKKDIGAAADAMFRQAKRGNVKAAKEIADRVDGPVRIEVTGAGAEPLFDDARLLELLEKARLK